MDGEIYRYPVCTISQSAGYYKVESVRVKEEMKSVLVLFNQVEEDEYEKLRSVDPASLDFTPNYDIHVATALEEYEAIVKALRSEGFRARKLNLHDDLKRLHRIVTRNRPDVVFNIVEILFDDAGLESAVAGLFDLYRIPYTGASAFSLSLCRRKDLTKQILLQNGIATPNFRLLDQSSLEKGHGLRYPVIVKPARNDGSYGVESFSVVYDYNQLVQRLEAAFDSFLPPVLVEEFLEGKELHVSVLGNRPPEVLPISEFDFSELPDSHPPLITYDVKWNPLAQAYHQVHSLCPAQISKREEKAIREVALRTFTVTSCRDYARIDMRLDENGVPHVLEVNPNPDLTESVSFMESAEEAGLSFSQTLRRIVEYALGRAS
jgi:D-alanine-D-alanine ligase